MSWNDKAQASIVDRTKTTPFLIKVSSPDLKESHIHTWLDATLREVVSLLAISSIPALKNNETLATLSINSKQIGCVYNWKYSNDDAITLAEVSFTVGDRLEVKISSSNPRGDPSNSQSGAIRGSHDGGRVDNRAQPYGGAPKKFERNSEQEGRNDRYNQGGRYGGRGDDRRGDDRRGDDRRGDDRRGDDRRGDDRRGDVGMRNDSARSYGGRPGGSDRERGFDKFSRNDRSRGTGGNGERAGGNRFNGRDGGGGRDGGSRDEKKSWPDSRKGKQEDVDMVKDDAPKEAKRDRSPAADDVKKALPETKTEDKDDRPKEKGEDDSSAARESMEK